MISKYRERTLKKYLSKAAEKIQHNRHAPNENFRIGIPCGKGTNVSPKKLCGNWGILEKLNYE